MSAGLVNPSGQRDFALLWAGQSVSLLGDQCLVLALPLITVGVLHGSASQAALLQFALYVPFLIFGLPAGVLLESVSRRTAMIFCNLLQAVAFGVVALLAAGGSLDFPELFAAVLCAGVAVVFFQVAYTSYTPGLFNESDDLHKANANLALSDSLSRTIGPAAGGALLAVIGATGVVTADALRGSWAAFAQPSAVRGAVEARPAGVCSANARARVLATAIAMVAIDRRQGQSVHRIRTGHNGYEANH